MKKILVATIIFASILSACSSKPRIPEISVQFSETDIKALHDDENKKIIEKILVNLGVSNYEYIARGNTRIVNHYDHCDYLYSTSINPLLITIRDYFSIRAESYVESIIDGVTEKCFYLGEKNQGHLDLYDYKTGDLISLAKSEEEIAADKQAEREAVEQAEKEREPDKIKLSVESRVNSEYTKTNVDSVTVNDDLGTGNGYIVLVNLTWNVKNSVKMSKDMLELYSDDLAATIADWYPSVHEIAVFWKVPYITTKTSKWAYTCKNSKAYLSDNMVAF